MASWTIAPTRYGDFEGAGTPANGGRGGLSRRAFCAIALSAAGGFSLAPSFGRERPEIGQTPSPHVWEYAYVYAYQ